MTDKTLNEPAIESQPTTETPITDNAENTVKESKNARKKRERRESLPRDPFFGVDAGSSEKQGGSHKSSGSGNSSKPFDFKNAAKLAKEHAPKIENMLNLYLDKREARCVTAHGDAVVIETMTVEKYGEVNYYIDDKGEVMRGKLSEAITFHLVVLSDGSMKWLEGFIKRHPQLVSFVAMTALVIQLEYTLRQHEVIAREIDKRSAAARAENATIDVEPTEPGA